MPRTPKRQRQRTGRLKARRILVPFVHVLFFHYKKNFMLLTSCYSVLWITHPRKRHARHSW